MDKNGKPKVEAAKLLAGVTFSTPADKEARKLVPNLFDLLCPRYRDGICTRQPGRLSIKVDGGCYRVVIECPTEGVQTALAVESIVGLAELVEALLLNGKPHWGMTWQKAKRNLPTIDDAV